MSLLVKRGDSPQDRFATEVLEMFRADSRVEDAWYDRDQFAISIRPVDGAPVWAHLSDLYQEWGSADPEARSGALRDFVQAAVAPPELPATWEQARPLVRPALCGVTATLPRHGDPESEALWRPGPPYLAEVVELALPGSPRVPVGLATRWGVPSSEIFAAARDNLAQRRSQPELSGAAAPRVLRLVDDGGVYWVSHLLLDGWLAGFAEHLGGTPVAFAPDRATLLLAPADPGLLTSVFEMVEEEYGQSARPVSPMAYTVDDQGRLIPYQAPAGHPLHAAIGRAERVLANAEYSRQKRWWDETGSPHRAGTLMLSGRTDGTVFSVAMPARGAATLLPRTDYLAVTSPEAGLSFVPWAEAERILGLKPEPDLEPPRFLLDAELSEETQQALRAAAVDPSVPVRG